MEINISTITEVSAGAITAVGGIYSIIRHLSASSAKKKDAYRQEILDHAKKEMYRIESSLESKIKKLEIELEVQKDNVSKDLGHLREVYNAEIKVLGEKIDTLRSDLQDQHSQMITLLTKLVNSR